MCLDRNRNTCDGAVMKILFINLPYYGHVVPTLGIVKELINLGCEVTYLLPFDFVKGKNPVVYISLGTVLKGAVSFFQNCIEAFRGEDVDVIISVGRKFKRKKLKSIPSNIRIYDSVPQLEVLKMADAFVTHGGMNSVSEALVYGTPMVVIPFVSDQPVNAQCIEKLGVGRKIAYSKLNAAALKDAVFSVIRDKEIRKNLTRVQERIKQAPGNQGGAKMIMEYYEKKVKACSKR